MSEEIAPEPTMAVREKVKTMSGNRGPRSGMTDNRYNSFINRAEGYVKTATGKFDWGPLDADFPAIRGIAERLAAAEIRWVFNANDKEAKSLHEGAMKTLTEFISHSEVAGGSKTPIISKAYGSYPLNPDARPFTGIKKSLGAASEADMRFWT